MNGRQLPAPFEMSGRGIGRSDDAVLLAHLRLNKTRRLYSIGFDRGGLHDHAVDNEEQLYNPLEGSGTLHAEGQSYPIKRGVLVWVGAVTMRKIVPGPEGMTVLMFQRPARLKDKTT